MSLSTYYYKNSPPFNECDIIEAALKAGFSDDRKCCFKISDVQRALFEPHGIKIRSVKWHQRQDITSGEKISLVLRSRADLFRTVKNGNRVSKFYVLPDTVEVSV